MCCVSLKARGCSERWRPTCLRSKVIDSVLKSLSNIQFYLGFLIESVSGTLPSSFRDATGFHQPDPVSAWSLRTGLARKRRGPNDWKGQSLWHAWMHHINIWKLNRSLRRFITSMLEEPTVLLIGFVDLLFLHQQKSLSVAWKSLINFREVWSMLRGL